TVNGAMSVKNLGTAPAGGTVEIAVKDAEGALISSLSREYVSGLAAGATHSFTRSWPVPSGTAGGQYRIEASVLENEIKMASNYDMFQVQNLLGVKPGISSDRLSYPANADVVLSSKVASASANFTYRDLKVTVSVASQDSTELMSNSYTVSELQPGRVDLQKINWNTGTNPPGQYTARQRIYDNDGTTLLAQSETVFTVMSSLGTGGFAGSISVTPQTVEGGSTYGISYEIRNTGNVDIADAELVKLVVNRVTLQNVGMYSEPLSLQKGQTYQNYIDNIQTSGYSFQKYLVLLRLKKADKESTVAATYLVMADTVPPVITNLSPINGTITNNGRPEFKALLSDNFSGIDDSSIVFKIDGTVFPTMYDNLTGFVSVTPETPLQDGVHALSLSVKDLAGNSATTPEWKISIDANPPLIASFIPADGSLLKVPPAEISAVITDAASGVKASSVVMKIDSVTVACNFDGASGKLLLNPANLADGVHTVEIDAADNAGNVSPTARFQFTVDTVAPVFSDLSPGNGSLTRNNQIALSAKAADALSGMNAQTVSISIDGTAVATAFDPATGILTANSPQLADGLHTISATASDMAGNQGTAPEWKITVDTVPPVISDLSPANGSNVNESMPVISAKVSDALSGIKASSITMSIAGAVAQVSYDPATGIVTATPPAQLQSGDVAVVLYVEDNAGNSSTTAGAWVFKVQTWLLFHNSSSGQLKISGSKKAFDGRVHSNASIKISGSDNDISGRTTAVGSIDISGSGNDVPDKQANASTQPMPVYDFDSYVARAAFTHNGDWHVNKNDPIAAGIHYVNGNVKISGSNVAGNVTIIATGYIRVSGSGADFANADSVNRMLFFSKTGDIDISGSGAKLKGIIYVPKGACSISGSGEDFQGAVIADKIDISGSNKNFGALE
ncbi:MAG: Ig-like domain-containing protein, partial [Victivallales bacterium]